MSTASRASPPPIAIRGTGLALPAHSATQQQFAEFFIERLALKAHDARFVRLISRKSGILRRHACILNSTNPDDRPLSQDLYPAPHLPEPGLGDRMLAYAEHAGPLARTAAHRAIDDASSGTALSPSSITHLVTFSCTGFNAPGIDQRLIADLGLSHAVERIHIGFMGCHAAINALRVARAIIAADLGATVLVAGVELSSLHLLRTDRRDQLVASCMFGDGAAAVVLSAGPARFELIDTFSRIIPDSSAQMGWSIGSHAFEMTLGEAVPDLIGQAAPSLWPQMTRGAGEPPDRLRDHALWCVHPGGPRVLEEVEQSLTLRPDAMDASRAVLRDLGNMSSVTTLFILDRLKRSETPGVRPRSVIALAFGPGLACEGAVLRLGDGTQAASA
ncbi:MAG: type III polyketide synthase [Phycisphaerales bacterium JB037]